MKKWIIICPVVPANAPSIGARNDCSTKGDHRLWKCNLEEALNQLSVEAGTPISFNTRLNGMTDEVTAQFDNATVGRSSE